MKTKSIELNNGLYIPRIGFGTWKMKDQEALESVSIALRNGYRLIDTAKIYGNEKGVGKAIRESDVPREEVFLTTKLWNDDQGYESSLKAFDESLNKLGLEYVDLYLMHWPVTGKRLESWRAMAEIYGSGKALSIGVSNFTIRHLQELLQKTDVTPVINQVEFHPFLYDEQAELLEYCNEHGIIVEAYSPLAHGNKALEDEKLVEIAERYGKSVPQIVLRWAVQHDTIPLPKSTSEDHIVSNMHIFDFELTHKDMLAIDAMGQGLRTCWNPNDMA